MRYTWTSWRIILIWTLACIGRRTGIFGWLHPFVRAYTEAVARLLTCFPGLHEFGSRQTPFAAVDGSAPIVTPLEPHPSPQRLSVLVTVTKSRVWFQSLPDNKLYSFIALLDPEVKKLLNPRPHRFLFIAA